MKVEINEEKLEELENAAFEFMGKFSMSYEQGIKDMIDVINGNADINELINQYK